MSLNARIFLLFDSLPRNGVLMVVWFFQWAEFMALGRDEPDTLLDSIISSQKPNQCCTLIYTSGTTGQPKGVMLSHDNVSRPSASPRSSSG